MNRNLLIEQVRQKMEELRSNYKMYENMQTYAVMRGLRLTHEAQAGYPDAPLAATPTVAPGTEGDNVTLPNQTLAVVVDADALAVCRCASACQHCSDPSTCPGRPDLRGVLRLSLGLLFL